MRVFRREEVIQRVPQTIKIKPTVTSVAAGAKFMLMSLKNVPDV
jgi:hypothetical protein